MIDIPLLLEEKAKERNERVLEQIIIRIATNQRVMEDNEYKKFISTLTRDIENDQNNQFDREKFEQLRFMTNMGANKTS